MTIFNPIQLDIDIVPLGLKLATNFWIANVPLGATAWSIVAFNLRNSANGGGYVVMKLMSLHCVGATTYIKCCHFLPYHNGGSDGVYYVDMIWYNNDGDEDDLKESTSQCAFWPQAKVQRLFEGGAWSLGGGGLITAFIEFQILSGCHFKIDFVL